MNCIEIKNLKFLYKDQYGKNVFIITTDPDDTTRKLFDKINKYKSLNPINLESKIIKFNDTKHIYKSREIYDILYFINKSENKKNKKIYINLHVSDMQRQKQKSVQAIDIEEV